MGQGPKEEKAKNLGGRVGEANSLLKPFFFQGSGDLAVLGNSRDWLGKVGEST